MALNLVLWDLVDVSWLVLEAGHPNAVLNVATLLWLHFGLVVVVIVGL